MKNNNDSIYESIVVLAVHISDTEDILFEDNYENRVERYRKLLNDCVHIMQENDCVDIVLYHKHIYGVYGGEGHKKGRDLESTGIRICSLVKEFNCSAETHDEEQLLCGIGIAAGMAVRIPLHSPFQQKKIWMGHVFEKAYSMAQMSVCDGRRRVFVDDSAEIVFYT